MSFKADGPRTRPERVKPAPGTHIRSSSASSSGSFHSARDSAEPAALLDDGVLLRFSPEEEESMLKASHDLKAQANTLFSRADYTSAISTYDRALAELPNYLDYEMAVLQSNIAACHLKLEQWKDATASCEKGLEGLERLSPTKKKETSTTTEQPGTAAAAAGSDNGGTANQGAPTPTADVVELPADASDAETAALLSTLAISDARAADIRRIRAKLLLRHCRARVSLTPPSWSALSGALVDYQLLASPAYADVLPDADRRTVRAALASLPARAEEAKTREVGEMMGKLKEVGDGVLGWFGLSTDNFKLEKGEGGGYSVSFDGAAGAGKK